MNETRNFDSFETIKVHPKHKTPDNSVEDGI